jgi:pimeloyl-ACP methyl ester carboxylesterase
MTVIELPRLHWGDPSSNRRALMVHGLGSSAHTCWQIAEALAEAGWSVTAVDLRGHGYAPRTSRYRISDFARDLGHVRPLEGDSWDLVIGHSIGAASAVVASYSEPGWVKKLVLLDPALLLGEERKEMVRAGQLHGHDHLTEEEIRRDSPHWHPLDIELKLWSHRTASRFAVEHAVLDNPNWDVVAEAKKVSVPTLIIGGDPAVDSMFTGEHADDVLGANPQLSLVVIEGAGHSVHRDRPAETIRAIIDFV